MTINDKKLSVSDHRRDSAGLKYVYPVISRRAGGVSVGINLNTNNACNWACSYCQVPGLIRGAPEAVDVELLEKEFRGFLGDLLNGSFMRDQVPSAARRLADVAFSGNGEPTSAPEFGPVVERVIAAMGDLGVPRGVPLRLITNGSLMHRKPVQAAVARLGSVSGEVWFKVDRASRSGILDVNGVRLAPQRIMERLLRCADLAPTWIQTCWFGADGAEPADAEVSAYLEFLATVRDRIRGVLLYGIARQPMQQRSGPLTRLSAESLARLAERIEGLGITVSVSP